MKEEMNGLVALLRAMNGEQKVIEHMEKESQMEAISNIYLSKWMGPKQEVWERLGFEFTDIPNDSVLCQGKLPEGWKMVPREDDAYCSRIIDQNGNVRGSFVYKPTFYDRHSSMTLYLKYQVLEMDTSEDQMETEVFFGTPEEKLFVAGRVRKKSNKLEDCFAASKEIFKLIEIAHEWANKHYPDWQDVGAYWDSGEKKTNNPIKTLK